MEASRNRSSGIGLREEVKRGETLCMSTHSAFDYETMCGNVIRGDMFMCLLLTGLH